MKLSEDNPLVQAMKNKSKALAGPEDLLRFVLENFDLVPKNGPPEEEENPPEGPSNIVTTQESHSA
jgi:hypothetical protein